MGWQDDGGFWTEKRNGVKMKKQKSKPKQPGRKPLGESPRVRVSVSIDAGNLEKMDAVAGPGRRSEFVNEAIDAKLGWAS